MNKPAIVIPVFQRTESLKKLLWSIERAFLPSDVFLIFRYHKGASQGVIDFIESYNWPFGTKKVISDTEKIDLDENLRRCGDLSQEFNAIIILEDDSIVSPYFFEYAQKAIEQYGNEEKIAQISLYCYQHNSISEFPFRHLAHNQHSFLVQKTSTRGQIFTKHQWQKFRSWLDHKTISDHKVPAYIERFGSNNWEFQHNQFLIDNGLFSLWPTVSLSSNQGFSGTHHPNNIDSGFFQVPLQRENVEYNFKPLENCYRYDAYFELEPEFFSEVMNKFSIPENQLTIDLQGFKPLECEPEYWLTSKPCENAIATFSDELKPIELNVLWQNEGVGISLCRKSDLVKNAKTNHYKNAQRYFAENTDVGLWKYLRYKWLKYVERKKLKK